MCSQAYHFFDLSLGGGFRGIKNRALMGCMSHRATNEDRESKRGREGENNKWEQEQQLEWKYTCDKTDCSMINKQCVHAYF